MLKSVSAVVGLALGGLLLSSAAQAASFQNGSFELGTFTPPQDHTVVLGTGSTGMPGWTVIGHEIAWIDAGNPFGLTASDGSKLLDLTSYGSGTGGGVQQAFDTVAHGMYTVTFDLGGSAGVQINASLDGGTPTTFTSTGAALASWSPQSLNFTASGSSTLLSFLGVTQIDNYIGLDNVQVTFNGLAATTPIPASLLMFGTGMLGLGFAGYRRNKTNAAA